MPMFRKSLKFLGFPNYQVSTDGTVWSCRLKGNNRFTDWHQLPTYPNGKPNPLGKYHRKAQLCNCGDKKWFMVHHLVLLAFRGPKPFPKAQARHLNDDPEDNRLRNLQWGTQNENMNDLKRNERFPNRARERNSQAKLTEAQVREIRSLYVPRSLRRAKVVDRKGKRDRTEYLRWSRKKLAERYGVSVSTIDFIIDHPERRWVGVT